MPPPAPPAQVVYGQKRHGYIDSLIYWRDPKASACVLAAGLCFFALTIVFRYSYTALACMFFLVHLLVSVSAERPLHCPACAPPRRAALCGGARGRDLAGRPRRLGVFTRAARRAGDLQLRAAVERQEGRRLDAPPQSRQGRGGTPLLRRPCPHGAPGARASVPGANARAAAPARLRLAGAQASKIALRVALDYNAAVDWYFGLAAARDLGTLGLVLIVLFGMWTVATLFSDSGLCLIGEHCARACAVRLCCVCARALLQTRRGLAGGELYRLLRSNPVLSGVHAFDLPARTGFVLSFIVPVMYDKNKALCDLKIAMLKEKIVAVRGAPARSFCSRFAGKPAVLQKNDKVSLTLRVALCVSAQMIPVADSVKKASDNRAPTNPGPDQGKAHL
jgi:hypothetical protein